MRVLAKLKAKEIEEVYILISFLSRNRVPLHWRILWDSQKIERFLRHQNFQTDGGSFTSLDTGTRGSSCVFTLFHPFSSATMSPFKIFQSCDAWCLGQLRSSRTARPLERRPTKVYGPTKRYVGWGIKKKEKRWLRLKTTRLLLLLFGCIPLSLEFCLQQKMLGNALWKLPMHASHI